MFSRQHFVALQHRNFRLLWIGQLVSFSGSMMQTAAILWHVSLLAPPESKGLMLGLVGLVRVVPVVVFSLLGGVMADAIDRRRLMLFTQTAMALSAAALAALTFSGGASLGRLYILAGLGAAFGSFDGPARNALIPSLVPRAHLPNALGLNSIMFQAASVLGPSLGGALIAWRGVGWVYAANAVSFLMVLWALRVMRGVPERRPEERSEVSPRAAMDGLRFVFGNPLIRSTMLLDFFATFFSSAMALLPIFAQDILHVGPHGYGLLYAAPSVGAIGAGLLMIRLVDRIQRRGLVLLWAVAVYGLTTVFFGLSRTFWLTFACLVATGAADMVSTVLRNVLRQLVTPDNLRGRMISINMIFFLGGPQLGELEAGLVAQGFGAVVSVVTGGIGCVLATAWTALGTPALRHDRHTAHTAEPLPATAAGRGSR
jgi:MFS family permease